MFNDIIKVVDNRGFYYEVKVEHHPELGISFAKYRELLIDRFEYGRYIPPLGDDDREWEEFQERFNESAGGDALAHFEHSCKEYFNQC